MKIRRVKEVVSHEEKSDYSGVSAFGAGLGDWLGCFYVTGAVL